MKISELVESLNEMKDKVGDVEVDVFTSMGLMLEVTEIRYLDGEDIGEYVVLLSDNIVISNQ